MNLSNWIFLISQQLQFVFWNPTTHIEPFQTPLLSVEVSEKDNSMEWTHYHCKNSEGFFFFFQEESKNRDSVVQSTQKPDILTFNPLIELQISQNKKPILVEEKEKQRKNTRDWKKRERNAKVIKKALLTQNCAEVNF